MIQGIGNLILNDRPSVTIQIKNSRIYG